MGNLKSKYKYCTSVVFYNSKLFRSHKFKVEEDKEFLQRAFNTNDEKTLEFYEKFYMDMLKNDRICERDLSSLTTFENDISFEITTDETLTLGDLVEGYRKSFSNAVSRGIKAKSDRKAKKQT